MNLIRPYLYGWNELEPTILACVATNQNMLLIGKHGTGKSSFMHFLGHAMSKGDEKYNVRKYSMDKENLISMVGIPNADALRDGRIEYSCHERSIFNADIALFDEITRASKENQNMVLEIMEEGTVFGKPLDKLKLRVATANDETYHGAMKLDAALLDRFVAVLPVPDPGTDQSRWGADEIEEMIRLNLEERNKKKKESDKELVKAIEDIKQTYDELWEKTDKNGEKAIANNVIEFSSKFLAEFHNNMVETNKSRKTDKIYVSGREMTRDFTKLVMAIASYFKVVNDDPEYLKNGAWEAIKYALSTKLCFPADKLQVIFEGLKELLTDGDALIGKVKIGITTGSIEKRLETFSKYVDTIKEHMELDEVTNAVGNILNELEIKKPEIAQDNMRHVLSLHDTLEQSKLAESCLWATRMKMWDYASSKSNEMLVSVLGWDK